MKISIEIEAIDAREMDQAIARVRAIFGPGVRDVTALEGTFAPLVAEKPEPALPERVREIVRRNDVAVAAPSSAPAAATPVPVTASVPTTVTSAQTISRGPGDDHFLGLTTLKQLVTELVAAGFSARADVIAKVQALKALGPGKSSLMDMIPPEDIPDRVGAFCERLDIK